MIKVSENEDVRLITVKIRGKEQLEVWCCPERQYINVGDIVISEQGVEAVAITSKDYVDIEYRTKVMKALGVTGIPCIVARYMKDDIKWEEED